MCRWTTFGARTSHRQTRTHKTHHSLDLGEATTFSLIVYSMLGHGTSTQMSFCPKTPKSRKFPQLGLLQLWGPITLRANLRLRWSLKQSCSPYWKISNGILQATYTQGNQVSINFLVVGSQIANLIPDPSFGHNLCVKCPNGSFKRILDIYVPKDF